MRDARLYQVVESSLRGTGGDVNAPDSAPNAISIGLHKAVPASRAGITSLVTSQKGDSVFAQLGEAPYHLWWER